MMEKIRELVTNFCKQGPMGGTEVEYLETAAKLKALNSNAMFICESEMEPKKANEKLEEIYKEMLDLVS